MVKAAYGNTAYPFPWDEVVWDLQLSVFHGQREASPPEYGDTRWSGIGEIRCL